MSSTASRLGLLVSLFLGPPAMAGVEVGFGKADITPDVKAGPVWIAGYGNGRKATGVHDPLYARSVVLRDGDRKIGLVSVDLVGIQYPLTLSVREALKDFSYVMVASTHNHEGPDVIGLWGPQQGVTGVDPEYIAKLKTSIVAAVREAEKNLAPAEATYGTAEGGRLMRDSRLPEVKDGVLRLIRFNRPGESKPSGILVQWNCHPESLDSENTEITADFPWWTVKALEEAHGCPVAYFSGAVGGLMSNPNDWTDDDGKAYHAGTFEYADAYGKAKARVAEEALRGATPIELTPFQVVAKRVALPLFNPGYRQLRAAGALPRSAVRWTGDFEKPGEVLPERSVEGDLALVSEVAYLRLGELHVAGIPGELYPELVYGKFQEPVEPNVDHPDAPLEPAVASSLPGPKFLMFGLANDEVGYIIPKRQWDGEAPFAYGREKGQYGEVNSVGPETAPILMEALARCVREASPR